MDHPEQFPLAAATAHTATSELIVTGTVAPDVSRAVPVVSLVSGRVTGIYARLGDTVQKGQRLLTVRSDDIAGGFSDYRKAVRTEDLTRVQLERAKDLYEHGAIALNDLQVAQQRKTKRRSMWKRLRNISNCSATIPKHPTGLVDILAPVSGVITDQQVTNAAACRAWARLRSRSPTSPPSGSSATCTRTTLPSVHLGDVAEISLNAYPDRVFKGSVSNIGAILDPNIRTAKVRIEVSNPGIMRLGMFVRATFHGQTTEMHTVVPASAILHMHDRDFVFVPAPDKKFRRVEVVGGDLLPDNGTCRRSSPGCNPGQQVVTNALVLDHVLAQ